MSCFPTRSKYERCACEPFVRCYNRFYSRTFSFRDIPDLLDSSQPQPDALYCEKETNACLVIERKNLMHLTGSEVNQGYGRLHNNDHRIMDFLLEHLPSEIVHGPFVFKMPFLHKAKKDSDIVQHARDICDFICKHYDLIQGESLEFYSDEPCAGEYALYRKDKNTWTEFDDGPWDQLIFHMTGPTNTLPRFNWNNVMTSDIPSLIADVIQRASKKFQTYAQAQKVLLLERHGDISGALHPSFETAIQSIPKPDTLDEIWDAWIETPDYEDPYWVFTRVWTKEPYLPTGWRRARIYCKTGCYCRDGLDPDDVFWFEDA